VAISIPKPSFLDGCDALGYIEGEKRWANSARTRIYTWDSLHGEIEVFNKRGKHIAVFDSQGNFKSEAIKGRCINV